MVRGELSATTPVYGHLLGDIGMTLVDMGPMRIKEAFRITGVAQLQDGPYIK